MKHFSLLLLFFCPSLVAGFDQSTIIWSRADHFTIDSIKQNDQILTYNNGQFCSNRVAMQPTKILASSYAVIHFQTDHPPIICSQFRQFLTVTGEWKKAIDLSIGDCLQGMQPLFVESVDTIIKPIILYDLCVVPNHTFCVGNQKLVAHNFAPIIGITISFLFGAGTAIEWSIFGGIAAGCGLFGLAMNKNNKKQKALVKPVISFSATMPNPQDPDNGEEKERKFNEISKTEFFEKLKDAYRFDKQTGAYKKIKGRKGLRCSETGKEIEYLKWDSLHGDVEAYANKNTHLGSIRPSDGVMYKKACNRQVCKKK